MASDMIMQNAERALRVLIRTADIPAGGRIPTQRRLADDLDVSTATVSVLLAKLAKEGLIIKREGGHGYRTRKLFD